MQYKTKQGCIGKFLMILASSHIELYIIYKNLNLKGPTQSIFKLGFNIGYFVTVTLKMFK